MAASSGKNVSLGSTTSLQQQNFTSEIIPKEYHRKVLKKIAQLTKVVHNLHTKVDESEDELQLLKIQHEKERQRLEEDNIKQVKEREEEKALLTILQTQLTAMEMEKKQLSTQQEESLREAELKFQTIKEQHNHQVHEMAVILSKAKLELSQKETEFIALEQTKHQLKSELESERKDCNKKIEQLKQEHSETLREKDLYLTQLRDSHSQTIHQLNHEKERELSTLRDTLSKQQDGILQNELQQYKESIDKLNKEYLESENSLKQELCVLSSELSLTKDKLALAEQKMRDYEREVLVRDRNDTELSQKLKEKEKELIELQESKTVVLEKNQLQKEELHQMREQLGQMEALSISQEHEMRSLQTQLESLNKKCTSLEEEKGQVIATARDSSDSSQETITRLEKELQHLGREKSELRAQFALEIESARSQLSERESVLIEDHTITLEKIKEKYEKEMDLLRKTHEESLLSLRAEFEGERSSEMNRLSQRYDIDVADLSHSLSKRTEELKGLQLSHSSLLNAISEKERHLESVKGNLNQLKGELRQCHDDLTTVKSERDLLKEETNRLKTQLINEVSSLQKQHSENLTNTETRVKKEMELYWSNKIKAELKALREELRIQNEEINRAALNKMADIKDTSLKQAEETWLKEKKNLLQKLKALEVNLEQTQDSSQLALTNAQREAENRFIQLKNELASIKSSANTAVEGLTVKHSQDLLNLRNELERDKTFQVERLTENHKKELEELTHANHLTCVALRDEMNKEKTRELTALEQYHTEEKESMKTRFTEEKEEMRKQLQLVHAAQLHFENEKYQKTINEIKKEIEVHSDTIHSLSEEYNSCKSLLLREKERGERLMIELSECQKSLQTKENEIVAVKREGETILRLREESLTIAHRAEIESINCQNKHQSQLLLNDFSKAKHLLNRKLQEKEKMLIEAEERYRSREARPQDIELIEKLKRIISEQELKLKELTVEKKLYEMELVNREKNYNQIFNATPLVGVINPLVSTSPSSRVKIKSPHDSRTNSLSLMDSLPSLTSTPTKLSQHREQHRTKTKLELIDLESSPHKLKFLSDTRLGGDKSVNVVKHHGSPISRRTFSDRKLERGNGDFSFTNTTQTNTTTVLPSSTVHVAQ